MIFKAAHFTVCLACAIAIIEYLSFGDVAYLYAAVVAFVGVGLTGWINELVSGEEP